METLSPVSLCRHARIPLTSRHPTEFIDVTDRVQGVITDAGVRVGVINVQTLHTTTGIVVNEHEPLLLGDFQRLLEDAVWKNVADDLSEWTAGLEATPPATINLHELAANNPPEAVTTLQNLRQDAVSHIQLGHCRRCVQLA